MATEELPDLTQVRERVGAWGMCVVDLDGTLLCSNGTFNTADLAALDGLLARGVLRVIATGRSLFSYRRALASTTLPVDFVAFSSGAGLLDVSSGRLLRSHALDLEQVRRAAELLIELKLDFCIHRPIPENHCFSYRFTGRRPNPDFERRLSLYPGFAQPLDGSPEWFGPATQLLAITPTEGWALVEELREMLGEGFSVIRATSPIDRRSTWIEIFPALVSKSQTIHWLASSMGLSRDSLMAIGNDYNDLDLLSFVGSGFVVENAPEELRRAFETVAHHDEAGVAQAVEQWLRSTKR